MFVKDIIDEDFVNYKLPSMFILFPNCNFKCGIENCQNYSLRKLQNKEITPGTIVARYLNNPLTSAIVFGGLEPFDDYDDIVELISAFRYYTPDPIIIYTGYTEEELVEQIEQLRLYENIIIKYGKYMPNRSSRFDDILGVSLASDNQYAVRISYDNWNIQN